MDEDKIIAISSGNYDNNSYATPHGAGRFVRNSFFNSVLGHYPEKWDMNQLSYKCHYTMVSKI